MKLVGPATALALVAAVLAATPGQADEPAAPGRSPDPAQGIRDQAAGAVAISKEPATGRVGFVRARGTRGDLLPDSNAHSASTAAAKAGRYLDEFGSDFGATDGRLERTGVTPTPHGWVVRFAQTYRGLPVFGAELKASVDRSGDLTAVSGYAAPDLALDTEPRLSPDRAGEAAVAAVRADPPGGHRTDVSGIHAVDPELMVYRVGATRGEPGEAILAWSVEVANGRNVRDRVFLDADSGKPVNRYSLIDTALDRRLYGGSTDNQIWREGEALPGDLDAEQQGILRSTEEVYRLFDNTFGRDSYDAAGATMKSVARYRNFQYCPNASWDGRVTRFCNHVASDDIVAHEWAHAYTEHTSDLVYQWQSGAMNEAYSDIWGETVDQLNTREDEAGTRWKIGEGATGFNDLRGNPPALRDMYQPTECGDPGKVSDVEYVCGENGDDRDDYGGIHDNSGVVNHAYALLVDGGTYNNRTVEGIGLDKAAHLFWQAQVAHLTPTSGFADLADALSASCTELAGQQLRELSVTEASGPDAVQITSADCDQVEQASAAVELRQEPTQCDFRPLLRNHPPRTCGRRFRTVTTWHEGFGNRLRGWRQTSGGRYRHGRGIRWRSTVHAPHRRSRTAHAPDPDAACTRNVTSRNSLISPRVRVRHGRSPRLTFRHYVATERGYDGGLLRIKVNRHRWQTVPRRAFRYNGPNTHLTYGGASSNPLAGYRAWSGTDQGQATGSWGTTQVNLHEVRVKRGGRHIRRGDRIRIRFDFGRDQCGGLDGWYVDNVRLVVCRKKHNGRTATRSRRG